MQTSLNFTTTWKGDKWNASNKAVIRESATARFALASPPCNGMMIAVGGVLLKLRYVSCKVWAKVVCCKLKLLHCQDSFSSVALLTKRSKSTSRLLRRWDDIGLGFSALGRDTWHPKSTLRWLNELATVSVSVTTVSERSVSPKILKEVNHERKHCSFSGHHDYACPAYWHLSGSYVS